MFIKQKKQAVRYRKFESRDAIFRLRKFIPKNSRHYTYRGSLTHPPCFSHVIWSVFEDPLDISTEQVKKREKKSM